MKSGIKMLVDGSNGVYVPQAFVTRYDYKQWGITEEDAAILRDAEHEWYWETWENVVSNAKFVEDGHTFHLAQDGDLWGLCPELLSDDEYADFYGEEREPRVEKRPQINTHVITGGRSTGRGIKHAALLAMMASIGASSVYGPGLMGVYPSVHHRRRQSPERAHVQRMVTSSSDEIKAWNAAVEAKKQLKKGAKNG